MGPKRNRPCDQPLQGSRERRWTWCHLWAYLLLPSRHTPFYSIFLLFLSDLHCAPHFFSLILLSITDTVWMLLSLIKYLHLSETNPPSSPSWTASGSTETIPARCPSFSLPSYSPCSVWISTRWGACIKISLVLSYPMLCHAVQTYSLFYHFRGPSYSIILYHSSWNHTLSVACIVDKYLCPMFLMSPIFLSHSCHRRQERFVRVQNWDSFWPICCIRSCSELSSVCSVQSSESREACYSKGNEWYPPFSHGGVKNLLEKCYFVALHISWTS